MMIDVLAPCRSRRDGAGRPRRAPQPLAAPARAGRDVLRGRARGGDARSAEGRLPDGATAADAETYRARRVHGRTACVLEQPRVRVLERPPMAELRSRGTALRLHRPRRHDARQGRVAAARRRGQLLDARDPRARGLPPRRRRGRDQVRAPQGTGVRGRAPDRPARLHLRDGLRARGRRRGGVPDGTFEPRRTPASTSRSSDAGAPRLLLETYPGRIEYHSPWHTDRLFSHLFRGDVACGRGGDAVRRSAGMDLRLVDNGITERRSPELKVGRGPHLPPDPARGGQGHARSPRTCAGAVSRRRT